MSKTRISTIFVIFLLLLSGVSMFIVTENGRSFTKGSNDENRSATYELTYTLDPGSLNIEKKGSYRSLSYSDFENGASPNAPSVPVKRYKYLLPKGVDKDSVEIDITTNTKKKLDETYHFQPMRKPATDSSTVHRREKDISIYRADSFYPEKVLDNIEVHNIRTASVLSFDYFPLKWNPITGRVILREDISIEIQYNKNNDGVSDPLTYDMISEQEEDIDNYEEVSSTYNYKTNSDSVTYAIVTTNDIVSNSNKLDDFKQYLSGKGYDVKLVTEDEYGTNTGQQRAIDIRNYLSNNYVSENIKYALLVGDPDPDDVDVSDDSYGEVPMMMCYPRNSKDSYRKSPTDYFYADLTGDWDLDGDGYYGEYNDDSGTDGVDFNAEIHVGRIPVYNDDYSSLDEIFSNMIDYQTKDGDWKKRMMLPMAISNYENEDDEGHSRTDGLDLPEYMYNDILSSAGFTDEVMYERSGLNPVDTSAFHYSQSISESNVIDEFNEGYGSVFWWGHGHRSSASRKYWGSDDDSDGVPDSDEMVWKDFMSSSSVSELETDQPSFFYQSSCLNGYPEVSYNLGYSLLKNGAAISTVSASRVSWYAVGTWSPNKELADNSGLGYYYMKSLLVDEKPAGEALSYAKSYTGEYFEGASWMNKFDFNLYGDPSQGYYSDNAEPTADAGEDRSVDEDTIVTFNGSDSTDDSGIVNYTWEIEGEYKYGEEVQHTFADPGTYEVTLKVTDTGGQRIVIR
ncbi:MAG: C25 family cysteine peptidase [Thermoplasmatota archaeon]